VTGDETWIHHFELKEMAAIVDWHHPASQKKFKAILSAEKVTATVFGMQKG